jgi:capsular polysaccharide biosynthesis protein
MDRHPSIERGLAVVDAPLLVRLLVQGVGLVGLGCLVGAAASEVYIRAQTPEYEATARTLVTVSSSGEHAVIEPVSATADPSANAAESCAEVATTPLVLVAVIRDLGLRETAKALAARVRVRAVQDSAAIDISALDPSPTRAARLANDIGEQLAGLASRLSPASSDSGSTEIRITPVRLATPPQTPTSPDLPTSIGLGALLGGTAGIGIASARALGRRDAVAPE